VAASRDAAGVVDLAGRVAPQGETQECADRGRGRKAVGRLDARDVAKRHDQPVVGEDVGPLLRLGEVLEPDRRHGVEAKHFGRLDPAMAGDDAAVLVDQDRIVEAERGDVCRDLGDLLCAMGAGVAGVGPQ
jgi:hypothetical protein